jgi:hypothetical protein
VIVNPSFNKTRQISSSGLDKALNKIGEDPKRKLVYHLYTDYGISLDNPTIQSADLQRALYSLVGSGADIIFQLVNAEMRSDFR